MTRAKKWGLVGGALYAVIFACLIISYITDKRDELIMLAIIGYPGDILFFLVGNDQWSPYEQAALLGLLGVLQYSFIGFALGKAFSSKK